MEKKGVCWAYSEGEVGHIWIEGIIGQEFYKEVRAQLESPSVKESKSLILHIQSPGGSVYAGYNTFHVLRSSGKPITSLIEGEAQSMATFISLAGSKKLDAKNGGIFILNPSTYMIHNPSTGNEGTADALQGTVDELRKIENEMAQAYSLQTGKSVDEMKAMMKKETRMSAIEAKNQGFVDDVNNQLKAVAIGKTMETKKETWKEKVLGIVASALGEVKAVDLKLASGKALHIEAEAGDLVGKQATIDGAVAPDGPHPLEDGRVAVVAAGIIQKIEEKPAVAPMPMPNPEEALKAQIATLTSQLATQQAAATTAEAEKAKIAAEKQTLVTAMAKIKEDLEKPVGDQENPNRPFVSKSDGLIYSGVPVSFARQTPSAQAIDATRTYLAQSPDFQWLHDRYPMGYFDKYKKGGPNAVSILETNFNYTWNGILTDELFYKPTLDSIALSDFFTIDQGINATKRYNLVAALDKILKPYGGCTTNPNTNRALITNATLVTKEFRMYEGWCKDDFTGQLSGSYNFLAQEWLKTGERSFDPAGTPIDTIIVKQLQDALRRDIFRRAFFAAGNSSDDDYNQFDGFWDRNIDSAGASNYCIVRAGTALGTGTLAAGNALTHLETAYAGSNLLLKQFIAQGKAKYFVTQTIWDNLYNSYIGSGAVTEAQFANLQTGLTTLKYKGIPVIPMPLWDLHLAEADNPLVGTVKHLIALTVKENHIFGVENGADLNKIDSWYEMKDSKRYYRSDMKMGYQYLHCDLTTIMY